MCVNGLDVGKRENAKSKLTSEQLEEWQGHFLVGMDGMGVVRGGREGHLLNCLPTPLPKSFNRNFKSLS